MQKRWNILSYDQESVDTLQNTLNINRTICTLLVQRGFRSFDKAKYFFRPELTHLHDPYLMKGMHIAVERLCKAFERNEKILVYGDYDVDGTTSVASMYQFLQSLHSNVDYYIPHRHKEGYGVSIVGIDYAKDNDCTLIVSLDCGIKSVEQIEYAASLGIDFIVCDHHVPDKILPRALAILNPKQEDCPYPYKDLCGCGVGFKLMQALAVKLNLPEESYLTYLDLVATAIAADIVSMSGENRVLAFYGLQKINSNPCPGLRALMSLGGLTGKEVSISNIVFVVAPRINAAGRMDDARKAVQVFTSKTEDEAIELANHLQNDNADRRIADESITDEALVLINDDADFIHRKTTVLFQEHWHKGVVGIVASRLIDRFYRPTIVLTKSGDIVAGSARSVRGYNLYEAIHACREHLIGYGGHFAAAGMTLLPENVQAFSEKFEKVVAGSITSEQLVPEIVIDTEVSFAELTPSFHNIISQMEPFGPDNLRPVFIARNVQETGFSQVAKELHIRFSLKQNNVTYRGIGFNLANKFHLLEKDTPIDVVFTLETNEWKGEKQLQLKVIDFREHI